MVMNWTETNKHGCDGRKQQARYDEPHRCSTEDAYDINTPAQCGSDPSREGWRSGLSEGSAMEFVLLVSYSPSMGSPLHEILSAGAFSCN